MEFPFGDDLFDSDNENVVASRQQDDNFDAKFEEPCWFLDKSIKNVVDENFVENERLRAAYFYWIKDYEKSLECYERVLPMVKSDLQKLECQESYTRTLLAAGRFGDAELGAMQFLKMGVNFDDQLQAFHLLSDLYWKYGSFRRCAAATAATLLLENGDPHEFRRLADCFRQWNNDKLIVERPAFDWDSIENFVGLLSSGVTDKWALWSYFKARELYVCTYRFAAGLKKDRIQQYLKEIDDIIAEYRIAFPEYVEECSKSKSKIGDNVDESDDNDRETDSVVESPTDTNKKRISDDITIAFKLFVERYFS